MDRPNLGFAIFLALLLLAPGIPVPGLPVNASASLAVAGLVVWFMLAPRLPVRVVLRMPTILALIGFASYVLIVSLVSGRLVSIAYAAQYAGYVLLAGTLIPAYLTDRARRGRQAEAWRILAWIGAVFTAGLVVSLWTGPFYPHQVGMHMKQYGAYDIIRGVGFAGSANAAGGAAAVLAAFYLFVYRPGTLPSFLLALLALAGLVATLSRSAMGAFLIAVCGVVLLFALRAVLVRGVIRLRLPLVPTALVAIALVAGVVSFQHPMVAAAWERLVLNEELLERTVDDRVNSWQGGVRSWTSKSSVERFWGSGFRSGGVIERGGVFNTPHNAYLVVLNDFGILGLAIFVLTLSAGLVWASCAVLVRSDVRVPAFCTVGLAALMVHSMTQDFLYDMTTLIFIILLLACGELLRLEQRGRAPSHRPDRLAAAGLAAPDPYGPRPSQHTG